MPISNQEKNRLRAKKLAGSAKQSRLMRAALKGVADADLAGGARVEE